MFTNAPIRSLALLMLAALASPLIAETQSINQSINQSTRVDSPRPVEVIYAVAETLPKASSSYQYSVKQTEDLQKFFAKPRHHKALTGSKDTAIKQIVGILTKRQTTTTLLTFNEKDLSKSSLHLSFDFKETIIGKKKVNCLKLTATSSKPLMAWQKEFVSSIVKTDSFFVRHPLLGASLGALTAYTVAGTLAAPAILRSQRKTDDAMEVFRATVIALSTQLTGAYKGEFFYENVPTRITNPLPSLAKVYDASYPTFDVSSFEIPAAATIAFIGIPGPGAITALVESGKLNRNENDSQVRILILPFSKANFMVSELGIHKSFFLEHNCLATWINDTPTDNPNCRNPASIAESPEKLGAVAYVILRTCTNEWNAKFTNQITGQADIASCATGSISNHVQEIRDNFTNPTCLVRYPTLDKQWNAIGEEETATTEVIILPVSSFLNWLLPTRNQEAMVDQLKSSQKTHLDFCNVPARLPNITKSIVCIINDLASPYILEGELTTPLIRLLCSKAATFRQNGYNRRFDDFFITLEPTSHFSTLNIHYITSEDLDGHDSSLADEENDTNNTVKVVTPSAAVTNTLRSSYQAAANYVERLLAPREYSDAAASVIAGMDDFAEFDVTAATAETSRKHAANKAAIAWTTPEAEDSEFKRFELDILAALKVLDPGIKKGYMRTSPTQDLSHLTQDLNGPQVRDEYRLIFAAHDQIGSITERTQLNTSCANNGWQLVVFGKTSLTHNNNRFFVNMYHDATSGKYVVSTHPNANSSKFTEYQDAIIKIAQTLKNNRRQMTDDFSEESSWRYRDSSTTTAGAGAGTGAGTGAGSSAPMLRRAEPTTALIAEQTAAKNAFDLLDLRETAKFFSKIKQSLIPAYIASAKIACLEVNNLTDPNNKSFIEQHRIAHRTCVAFSNNNESEIRTFFERLHADYCNNVFIVHGYEHSKALHDTVTIFKYVYENYTEFIMDRHVTQSKGRLIQEHISLQKFKDILLTPLPPVSV